MNDFQSEMLIPVLLALTFFITGICFLLTQFNTLKMIRPENRQMPPQQVWLQIIPFVGHVWQFFVIRKISDSLRNELNTPINDDLFAEDLVPSKVRPTFFIGISYAILMCLNIVMSLAPMPYIFMAGYTGLAGIICWIVYWVQLAQYKKKLKNRLQLTVL